ncbi:hypothetical protein [Mycoplasma suis]|uniref:Uncharacterized protein n=2 Tax=Mycoplasma suis TaxID=57372 RepID=F0QQN9_MYCSL|nr:hypothetical protein [Mycoplasma suis]ADX97809.1 hypothetical protein MSU_0265 [Mycoplasma suis str. Illinois]CBZ40308.1 hypothetical protein MSUIS_02150 [Mycoplasma suis KI3806]
MLSSKLSLLLGGSFLATGSSVGLGLKYFLGEVYGQSSQTPRKINFREKIEDNPPSPEEQQEKITEVKEDDLFWEYILYYGTDKKKCEFGGRNKRNWETGLGSDCTTEWLKKKSSKWEKKNDKSETELSIRRKKDFVYDHETSNNGDENPRIWISYFLDEFRKDNIKLDFDPSDCNVIPQNEESKNRWNEWNCYLAVPSSTN